MRTTNAATKPARSLAPLIVILREAWIIEHNFIANGSPYEINVAETMRNEIKAKLQSITQAIIVHQQQQQQQVHNNGIDSEKQPSYATRDPKMEAEWYQSLASLYGKVAIEVERLISYNSYKRFKESSQYEKLIIDLKQEGVIDKDDRIDYVSSIYSSGGGGGGGGDSAKQLSHAHEPAKNKNTLDPSVAIMIGSAPVQSIAGMLKQSTAVSKAQNVKIEEISSPIPISSPSQVNVRALHISLPISQCVSPTSHTNSSTLRVISPTQQSHSIGRRMQYITAPPPASFGTLNSPIEENTTNTDINTNMNIDDEANRNSDGFQQPVALKSILLSRSNSSNIANLTNHANSVSSGIKIQPQRVATQVLIPVLSLPLSSPTKVTSPKPLYISTTHIPANTFANTNTNTTTMTTTPSSTLLTPMTSLDC